MIHISHYTASLVLVGITFYGSMLAMYIGILRWGPKRGNYGSPAASFRHPGVPICNVFRGIAALFAVSGVVVGIVYWGQSGLGIFLTCLATAGFYFAVS